MGIGHTCCDCDLLLANASDCLVPGIILPSKPPCNNSANTFWCNDMFQVFLVKTSLYPQSEYFA